MKALRIVRLGLVALAVASASCGSGAGGHRHVVPDRRGAGVLRRATTGRSSTATLHSDVDDVREAQLQRPRPGNLPARAEGSGLARRAEHADAEPVHHRRPLSRAVLPRRRPEHAGRGRALWVRRRLHRHRRRSDSVQSAFVVVRHDAKREAPLAILGTQPADPRRSSRRSRSTAAIRPATRPRRWRGPRFDFGNFVDRRRVDRGHPTDGFIYEDQAAFLRAGSRAIARAVLPACTMKSQEAPDFAGPSEFGKSITVTVTPDAIVQDGASQSVVTVTALGSNGQPLANIPLRAEIRVDGVPTDFGSLSARNLVTDANGRATLVYTAPATVAGCRGRYPDSRADRRDRGQGRRGQRRDEVRQPAAAAAGPGRSAERLAAGVHERLPATGRRQAALLAFRVSPPAGPDDRLAIPGTSVMAQWRPRQVPSASHAYAQSGTSRDSRSLPRTRSVAPGPRPGRSRSSQRRRRPPTSSFSPSEPAPNQDVRSSTPRRPTPAPGRTHRQLLPGTSATARPVPRCPGAGGLQLHTIGTYQRDVDRHRRSRPTGASLRRPSR